jgi:MFS family permease
LFSDLSFALVNTVSIIVNYGAFSILLLVPYFLVRTAGLESGIAGVVLALAAVGAVAGSWLAGRIAQGVSTVNLVMTGIVLSLAGLTAIAQWSAATGLGFIALALLVQGFGVGLFNVAYTDLVTATLPLKDRGVAGSLTMVTRTIGVVAGATLHSQIQRSYEAAAQLAGATADVAFVAGFQAAFVAAAVVMAGGLVMCLPQAARRPPT